VKEFFGAFIAALFGILSSLFLDYLKKKNEQQKALRTVVSELERINRFLENYAVLIKNSMHGGFVFNKILSSNSWRNCKHILMDIVKKDNIKEIENIYFFCEESDRKMELAIQAEMLGNTGLKNEFLKFFWGMIDLNIISKDSKDCMLDKVIKLTNELKKQIK